MTEPPAGRGDTAEQVVRPRTPGRRVALVVLALAAGAALWAAAPPDWPPGSGSVELRLNGAPVVTAAVEVGSTAPLVATSGGDRALELTLPGGVPTDRPIEAVVAAATGDTPGIEDIEISITLPDGRREFVPVVRVDEAAATVEAVRRPTNGAGILLGLLGLVVVLWVTEAFPLFVTSLAIPVVLVMSGVAGAASATAPFFNPIIVLFFAGFLMAEAMRRSGLDHYVAVTLTARGGRSPAALFAVMLAVAAFLSMWMSNTAAAAVLIPIAIAVSAPLAERSIERALVLGIAYASTVGGVGSAIGTPANQLAIELLDSFAGVEISFVSWFGYGLPMVGLMLPVVGFYLWRREGVAIDPERFASARAVAEEERRRLGHLDRPQVITLAVFALVAAGWLTETFHGVHAGIVALAGAVVLFALGRLQADDLAAISWPALLTFGGGLTLGLFLVETGTSDYVATRLTGLAALPGLAAIGAVALVTLALTTVASNTASAAILIPLAIPLSVVLGIDATTLVVVVAIASSIDFALVIGTPPTMIAYSTRLFTAGQIFRMGVFLDLAGLALLVLVVTRIWRLLGLV